jgi:hypothetical protein
MSLWDSVFIYDSVFALFMMILNYAQRDKFRHFRLLYRFISRER